MRGAGRAATLKNAKQKTVEVHAQEISKIAIGLNAAFTVPRISISHQPAPPRCCAQSNTPRPKLRHLYVQQWCTAFELQLHSTTEITSPTNGRWMKRLRQSSAAR